MTWIKIVRRWLRFPSGRRLAMTTVLALIPIAQAIVLMGSPLVVPAVTVAVLTALVAGLLLTAARSAFRASRRQAVLYDELVAMVAEKVKPGGTVHVTSPDRSQEWIINRAEHPRAVVYAVLTCLPGGDHLLPVHAGGRDTGERLVLTRRSLIVDQTAPTVRSEIDALRLARINGEIRDDQLPSSARRTRFRNTFLAEQRGYIYADNWEITEALDALVTVVPYQGM